MAQKTQMVTITLAEYKELLLKDKVVGNEENRMFDKLITDISNNLEKSTSTYSSSYIGDDLEIKNANKIITELVQMMRYVDSDKYMELWNGAMTKDRKSKEMKAQMEQMNEAKELRQDIQGNK